MTATAEPQVAWAPQAGPQTALVACPIEDVFFGGARYGGKTDALLGDFALRAGQFGPATRGVLFRRTYPELEEIERRAYEVYQPLGAQYTMGERVWTFPNGATLKFRHLERLADAGHYIGHQYSWEGFDQLEQWPTADVVDLLWGSLRSPEGVPCVRRCTGNPGGPGHHWVKARYIQPAAPGLPFKYQPQPGNRPDLWIEAVFIPSKAEDNPLGVAKDPRYEARLAAAGGPELFRAWRYGDWDAVVGQVFAEWRADLHLEHPDFKPGPTWRGAAGLDFGYRAPTWFGVAACGPEGDVVFVEELVIRERYAQDQGYQCGMLGRRWPVEYIAADIQMWQVTGAGVTVAEEFQRGLDAAYGGPLTSPKLIQASHGPGSLLARVDLTHKYLAHREGPDGTVPPWGRPRLRFHPRCRYAIQTIPALTPDDPSAAVPVPAVTSEKHAWDGVGYLLQSRPPLGAELPKGHDQDTQARFDYAQGRKLKPWEQAWQPPDEAPRHWKPDKQHVVPLGGWPT